MAITLNQFLDQWLATSAKPRLRARTFHDYESLLRLYIRPALGKRLIGTIGQMDMQALYAQMFGRGLSARTIEYTNAVLESAFRQAVRWRMLGEDPCAGVDLPRVKRKEMEALSVEECRRFLSVAEESEWYALFVALALTTGMRPSEYLALKWSDIDWQRGAASVSRTIQVSGSAWAFDDTKRKRSRRVVKLQTFVLAALHTLREKQRAEGEGNCSSANDLTFVTETGMPLRESGQAGIPPAAGEGRYPVRAPLRSAPHRGHAGNCGWSLREGDLGSAGTCQHLIHAGALFACFAFDSGRSSCKGRKAFGA